MRTMKPKAKLKKNGARFARMKLTSAEATSSEPPDLSQLRKPIDISLSCLRQVVQLFDKGSDEVKAILTYECDVVYECRICRSLFRSLANFISHKRAYCLEKHNVTPIRRNIDHTEAIYEDDLFPDSEISIAPDYMGNHTNDRILRSQNSEKEPKKDLTSVVDMLTKRQNEGSDYECTSEERRNNAPFYIASDGEEVMLEVIDNKRAAYQTVLRNKNFAANSMDLMKTQSLELKSMLNRNTGVLGPDGQLLEISDAGGNDSPWGEQEEFELNVRPKFNREVCCPLCDAKFSTKKTMTFHVKTKHVPSRMCYPCPCCAGTFTNRWSVYRHLFKVHRKSNEQVRRLRSHIQARAFRRDLLRFDKVQRECDPSKLDAIGGERITEDTQEWMENLELDAELQRCGGCGKRFERKAALASHRQICRKRGIDGTHEGTGRHKRARKIPPRRASNFVETGTRITGGADNSDRAFATISALSKESNDWKIIPKLSALSSKPRSNLTNRKTDSSLVDRKNKGSSILRKRDSSKIVRKSDSSTIVTDVPMEISIRVEDVSSLSKDMWDKIGTSENETDRDSPLQDSASSPSISSPQGRSSLNDPTEIETNGSSLSNVNREIPEVIYTSIDNSAPVALSVIGTEKKLGIQYRGIRLPTVTLEKINVPRSRINESSHEAILSSPEPIVSTPELIVPSPEPTVPSPEPIIPCQEPAVPCLEPNISINLAKERTAVNIDKIRQPTQFRKLQCLPCNRRFMTMANWRRHIGVHMRHYRYRCKLCDDFKSLLKCDLVAHCNKKHNAKNNRSLLAELVIEVPMNNDPCHIAKTNVEPGIKIRREPQTMDVCSTSTDKQIIPMKNHIENEMTIDAVPNIDTEETLPILQPRATSVTGVPNLRPRRGRPPNSQRKGKRGRDRNKKNLKKKIVAKARIVRHVSPPRLPDDSSEEIKDIVRSTDESADSRSDEFSCNRAPSRMDCDPELRKMVMEVIFGSSQKETNKVTREQENDPTLGCNEDESVETLEHNNILESLIPRDEQDINVRNDILEIAEKNGNAEIEPITDDHSGDNLFLQQYHDYELKTIDLNHDTIVLPKNSNYVAIQVSTASPLICVKNHAPSLTISTGEDRLIVSENDNANDDLTEAQ